MALDDFLAERQADAGARILVSPVKPLEHLKDPLEVFRVDPDPVVEDAKRPVAILVVGRDTDDRSIARSPELDRVANQVLKHLGEL